MNSKTKSCADLLKHKANQKLQAIKSLENKSKSTKHNLGKAKQKQIKPFIYVQNKHKTLKKIWLEN